MPKRILILLAATAALSAAVTTRMRGPEPAPISELPQPLPGASAHSPVVSALAGPASPAPVASVSVVDIPAVPDVAPAKPAPPRVATAAPTPIFQASNAVAVPPPVPSRDAADPYRDVPLAPQTMPLRSADPIPSYLSRRGPGGVGSSPARAPLAVELDYGVPLPIALIEEEEPLSPVQAVVKKQIAEEFASQVQEAVPKAAADPQAFEDAWFSAHARANWEYQMFFGGEAANRAGMRAALEALAAP